MAKRKTSDRAGFDEAPQAPFDSQVPWHAEALTGTPQEARKAEGRTGKQKTPRTPNSKASRPARAPRIEGTEGIDLMEPGSGIAPASQAPVTDDLEVSMAAREARDNLTALLERGRPFYVPDDAPD